MPEPSLTQDKEDSLEDRSANISFTRAEQAPILLSSPQKASISQKHSNSANVANFGAGAPVADDATSFTKAVGYLVDKMSEGMKTIGQTLEPPQARRSQSTANGRGLHAATAAGKWGQNNSMQDALAHRA